ncbi:unnamed protein product [Amoebophrya sp. A25]|nr:unnamed protein product [Amoebophrya sp. A25]|eukprot:GSA25T00011318001.1
MNSNFAENAFFRFLQMIPPLHPAVPCSSSFLSSLLADSSYDRRIISYGAAECAAKADCTESTHYFEDAYGVAVFEQNSRTLNGIFV